MVRRLVAAALGAPAIVFLLVAGLIGAGLYAYSRLDIEAYPNPVPPLVEVITQPEGRSAEEVERQFKAVPGVIDVVSFGGETKQYQVEVDPYRLRGQKLTLQQLMQAIANANQNVGGQRLTLGEQAYTVRGLGLFRGPHDIENVVGQTTGGVPVRVRDVATVREGARPRLGIAGHTGGPAVVEGIVLTP